MTIDELAHRSGTTSRNIRAYQERGLLPPPRVIGRVGHYNEGHFARLHHINQLSERGFSLAAIRELFKAWERGYGLDDVLGFEQALASWKTDVTRVSLHELTERFGADASGIERAVELGLIEPDPETGDFIVPNARILDAGAEMVSAGVPLAAVLEEAAKLQADLDAIAVRFVALFRHHIWGPYEAAGMPRDELSRITELLHRMRPLAGMAVSPLLASAMAKRVAETAAETLAAVPAPTAQNEL